MQLLVGRVTRLLGPHGRRAAVLMSGAVVSQVIPIAASPALTRLYDAQAYGNLALFGSLVAIIGAVASGRYHMAITLPASDEEAERVAALGMAVAAVVCSVSAAVVLAWYFALPLPSTLRSLGPWLLVIPLGALLASVYETLTYFSLRLDKLSQIARANVQRAGAGAVVQVALGASALGAGGLIVGSLTSLLFGNRQLFSCFKNAKRSPPSQRIGLRGLAIRYGAFPKYDVWSNLANVLGANILIVGIAAVFSASATGQYALAFRILTLPAALVGGTVSQVYLREASRRRSDVAAAKRAFDKTAIRLLALSLLPFLVLILFGGDLFAVVFGEPWRQAGVMSAAMMPVIWTRFVVSPVSTTFLIYERQRPLLVWQIAILVGIGALFAFGRLESWDVELFLRAYGAVIGALYIFMFFHARSVIHEMRKPVQVA